MCSNIGLPELVVILMLLVLVFGASRLPQLGETVGKTIRSFKRGMGQHDGIQVTKLESRTPRSADPTVSDAQLNDASRDSHDAPDE